MKSSMHHFNYHIILLNTSQEEAISVNWSKTFCGKSFNITKLYNKTGVKISNKEFEITIKENRVSLEEEVGDRKCY
jgi:hypothetical protein